MKRSALFLCSALSVFVGACANSALNNEDVPPPVCDRIRTAAAHLTAVLMPCPQLRTDFAFSHSRCTSGMANACTAAEQNAYRRWADCVDALAVCEPANQTRTVDALQVCNDALANSTTQMCQESITP